MPTKRYILKIVIAILGALPVQLLASELPTSARTEILHLLGYIGKSGCEFNRNGSWHTSPDAAVHLKKKFDYLDNKNQLSNTEEFILKAATASSISKKPYLVKCPTKTAIPSAAFLEQELHRYRANTPR